MKLWILASLSVATLGCSRTKPEPLVRPALNASVYVSLKSDAMSFTKEKLDSGMVATSGRSVRFVKGKLTAIDPEWLELEIPANGETPAHQKWVRVSEVVSVEIAP